MTIKSTFVIIFFALFFSHIIAMEIEENDIYNGMKIAIGATDNKIHYIELPYDAEQKILTHLDLQSLGRIKLVCQRYNNWIDFENNILGPHAYCITKCLSQNFNNTEKALISAAHGGKRDFMQNIILFQQTVKDRWYRKYCLGFIRDEFASRNDENVIFIKDYINAYKGIINERENDKQVLKWAIKKGNVHATHIILSNDYYKENSIPEKMRVELLLEAIQFKRKNCLELLLSKKQFDVNSSYDGLYPLYAAVNKASDKENGNISIVQLLLDLGAKVNQNNSYYVNRPKALHCAALGENIELVKLLLDKGADINQRDKIGKTPLMYACGLLNKNMISYLLNVPGICINQQDNDGDTALMYGYSDFEVAKLLLDKGTDINIQNKQGQTVLHKAATYAYLICKNIIELLLERNAIKDITDNNGCTPLMCAINSMNEDYAADVVLLLTKAESGK